MNKITPLHKRGDPWFDDGNIVLVPEDSSIAFKVHRDFLSRHSEIFKSMFELPTPTSEVPLLDDCQVVPMYDLPFELSNLIKALYDGTGPLEDFLYTAGILRLSTKYFITRLRIQAIQHLVQTTSHIHMSILYMSSTSLGRTNVQVIIPSVLYFLTLYHLSDLLSGNHVKLQVDHPSCPSADLSPQDLQAYTIMYQERIQIILRFIRHTCGERTAVHGCQSSVTCTKAFTRVSSRLSRTWRVRTGPLSYMVQVSDEVAEHDGICGPCKRPFRQDVTTLREDIWRRLPSVVGMSSWEELTKNDMPKP
ncbi:hypothetical protein EUX98_g3533 [Antrodiella citrinella]|uniref:BTB domain-containing protein n=1 Tax=Antrodiella citrinella TaxID=2447956 RepID=A0A4S4MYT1_9APHY|nr:hypothetical protein EUX98_g3533 [Antrodiella citrinella]